MDTILRRLRDDGASIIDSIATLRDVMDMPLQEAKRTVHFSPVWDDVRENNEKFWDELESGLADFADKGIS